MKETLGTYYCSYFKMPQLFRDDLEAIELIVKNELKSQAYYIAFDGREYDDLKQIPEDAGRTSTLVIYTHQPCLRLKFARSWAELYAGDASTPQARAALERISEIIRRTERRRLWVISKLSTWFTPLFTCAVLAEGPLVIVMGMIPRREGFIGIVLIALLGITWWIVGQRYSTKSFCYLDLRNRRAPK